METIFVWKYLPIGEYRLYIKGKTVLSISHDYRHARKLLNAVLFGTGKAFWTTYAEKYLNGETIFFGKHVTLNRLGIGFRQEFVSWETVAAWETKTITFISTTTTNR